MKIKIFWTGQDATLLLDRVNLGIDELGLTDTITTELTTDDNLKVDLKISQSPALVIEEESIWFQDMIFEGMVPEADELKSMFISIMGGGESGGWCGSGGCAGCSGWCS